jgi:hypothetical protein
MYDFLSNVFCFTNPNDAGPLPVRVIFGALAASALAMSLALADKGKIGGIKGRLVFFWRCHSTYIDMRLRLAKFDQ